MDSVSIFQIKSDITDPDDILVDRDGLWSHHVRIGREMLGMLYLRETILKRPTWIGYFENLVDFTDARVETGSLAAVLLVKRGARLYAVTFGYGRYLLYDGVIEPRFGLRVTLNAIESSRIRSIDHKRLEAVSRHTREQLSREAGLEHFGLDVERDLLRGVVGTPRDETLGKRLAGADQLNSIGKIPIRKLGEQIDRYAELATSRQYRDEFPWVDNIAEITDVELRDELDDSLVQRLKSGDWNRIWMAPPEILEWSDIQGFAYSGGTNADVFEDLDLNDYIFQRGPPDALTSRKLGTDRVWCRSAADGSVRQSWSIHRCLVAELDHNRNTFVLNESRWYQIDHDFLTEVDDAIAALPQPERQLPLFNDASEGAYNERAVTESAGYYALMDKKLIQTGHRGSVEACDLYGRTREFVHVKRYSGSSTLSHLFNQGVVSAQLMLSERLFRYAFNQHLPESHRLEDPTAAITPSEFEIAYAIVAKPGRDIQLPFFSKATLRNAASLLRQWGYRVTLSTIGTAE